ncbi:MAG: repressor LexA, partial [Rhodocyclales bacterium]|nr:repressor LexA [Rhodocyclales bacterium]
MADDLTPRQREILDFIRNSLEVFSVPPTRAEIAGAFGFASANAAEDHLKALAKKGAITLEHGSARGIRLVEQLGLPLIG